MGNRVNLSEWRRSNPEKTSPKGRGGWLYRVEYFNGDVEDCKCFPGTYTESRRAALRYANQVAAREVYLLP